MSTLPHAVSYPCPMCGSWHLDLYWWGTGWWSVECLDCLYTNGLATDRDEAARLWNEQHE